MRKLNVLICLSDNKSTEKLHDLFKLTNSVEIISDVKTKMALIEKLTQTTPDILFVDLDDEEINFTETIKLIVKPPFIIGVTATKEKCIDYLDLGIFDFAKYPILAEDIYRKISKILLIQKKFCIVEYQQVNESTPTYKASSVEPKIKEHTFVRHNKTNTKIFFDDILYIRNTGNCLRIESYNNKIFYHNSTLKQFLTLLPENKFIRINKSIIVNYNRIERYEKNLIYLKKTSFKVSRIYAGRLKSILKKIN